MKKKHLLKPLALAALVTLTSAALPAWAQSSVTLYGIVDDAVVYANNQGGHSNLYLRNGNLAGSRFGLRGTEDLGGGTSAIFDLEEGYDVNNGTQSSSGLAFNRQAFVGLSNARYGTLTAGRQYSPYYAFVGPLGPTAILTGATGAHPGDIDGLDTTIRVNNSLVYTTPNIYGLRASAMYAFGGQPGSLHAGSTISAALRYDNGPLSLAAGYLKLNNAGIAGAWSSTSTGSFGTSSLNAGYTSAKSVQHVALAGNYTFGKLVLGATFTNVEYTPGEGSLFHDTAIFNTAGITAVYPISPALRVAAGYSYTAASQANGIQDAAKYHQVSLLEVYQLSKRYSLYALQAYQKASGQTLHAGGTGIVDATASVGDSQNGSPSSTSAQFVAMFGMRFDF